MNLIEPSPRNALPSCESGLRTHEDLTRLRAAGFDAFLIGEHLMAQPDPAAALRALLVRNFHAIQPSHRSGDSSRKWRHDARVAGPHSC